MRFAILLLAPCLLLLTGCSRNDQMSIDEEKILRYLENNMLDAERTESGLYYIIDQAGTGNSYPNKNSFVTVKYTGSLLDGTIFDQTAEGNVPEFQLTNVIQGWQEGIPLFQKGGKGTLIIPSQLGYGSMSIGPIPANSVLVFDIELIDFRD